MAQPLRWEAQRLRSMAQALRSIARRLRSVTQRLCSTAQRLRSLAQPSRSLAQRLRSQLNRRTPDFSAQSSPSRVFPEGSAVFVLAKTFGAAYQRRLDQKISCRSGIQEDLPGCGGNLGDLELIQEDIRIFRRQQESAAFDGVFERAYRV